MASASSYEPARVSLTPLRTSFDVSSDGSGAASASPNASRIKISVMRVERTRLRDVGENRSIARTMLKRICKSPWQHSLDGLFENNAGFHGPKHQVHFFKVNLRHLCQLFQLFFNH